MPTLPTPGGDVDVWGNELNTFLSVGMNADGSLKSSALSPPITVTPTSPAVNVTQFGVVPSSPTGTDVTAALITLINTQVAAAQANGTNYVELYFPPGVYRISGALTQGGATKGNAQIPLPVIAPTVQKVTLILRSGPGGGDTLPLWTQTVGQKSSGACLYTTGVTGAYSGTYGTSSVLAGPTSEQGYGNSVANGGGFLFSNMHVVLDGISVCSAITNPTMSAFDFSGVAQLTVRSAGAFCDAATLGTGGVGTILPSNNWVFGLRPPNQGNNALNNIYSFSCEGYYTGFVVTEHCVCTRILTVYCQVGIRVNTQQYAHGNVILYACVESCLQYLQWDTNTHAIVYDFDVEHNHGTVFDGGNDINDSGNNARGYVGFEVSGGGEGEGTEPVVNGALNLKINNIGRKSATFNIADVAPAINFPASGASFQNPFWKDALIAITGGTITGSGIQVSAGNVGARTLFSATPCLVPLPSGGFITVNYTGSPTWVWTLI